MQVESSKGLRRGRRALVLAATVLVAGCKLGGTDLGPPLVVHSVTFPSHMLSLVSCQAVKYMPTVAADSGAVTAVVWSSKDSTVAFLDSLGNIHGLKPGSALVRASAFMDTTKFDTVRVSVSDPTGPFVTIGGVLQAATGDTANLSALHDSVDVVLHVSPLGCRKNGPLKITSADAAFTGPTNYTQTFAFTSGISGSVYLRVNTARVDSTTKQPVLPNGSYTLAAHVKSDSGTVYTAPTTLQVTIANP